MAVITATSFTTTGPITLPAGAPGDQLVANVLSDAVPTTPSGWTASTVTPGPAAADLYRYRKVRGADTDVTFASATDVAGVILNVPRFDDIADQVLTGFPDPYQSFISNNFIGVFPPADAAFVLIWTTSLPTEDTSNEFDLVSSAANADGDTISAWVAYPQVSGSFFLNLIGVGPYGLVNGADPDDFPTSGVLDVGRFTSSDGGGLIGRVGWPG